MGRAPHRGAARLTRRTAPWLTYTLRTLARRAGIPEPLLYLSASAEANAVSMDHGRGPGAVVITTGLLQMLDRDEVEGVLAHEVAHLRNRDSARLTLAALAGRGVLFALKWVVWVVLVLALLSGIAVWTALQLVALGLVVPFAVAGLRQWLSRSRELAADDLAARLSGRPWALASALQRLNVGQRSLLARLGIRDDTPPWLRSHPATGERIRRLMSTADVPRARRSPANGAPGLSWPT